MKKGIVRILTNTGTRLTLEDVYYSADADDNLLSVKKLQRSDMDVLFRSSGETQIHKDGNLIILYESPEKFETQIIRANLCILKCTHNIWHKRLGHSKENFVKLKQYEIICDKNTIKNIKLESQICEACIQGRQVRLPSKGSKDKSYIKSPLSNVHSDICGPITSTTVDNNNYFFIFIDEYTHYC